MTLSNKVEGLNVLLILASLVLALLLPFELFLFSYAVLGPLHYLTEINWLNKNNYFINKRKYVWVLLFFTFLISFIVLFRYLKFDSDFARYLKYYSKLLINILIATSFFFSIGLVLFKDNKRIVVSLIFALLLGLLFLKFVPFSFLIIGVFLPTIIHVYLFTLLFMVSGTLKSRSIFGVVAIVLLILVPIFIAINMFSFSGETSDLVKSTFLETRFKNVLLAINQVLNDVYITDFNFNAVTIIKMQTFLAFSYTYHYLNWFSKISIIKWTKGSSKSFLALLLVLWLASIGLYLYNYRIGILTLYFLSLFHVIVEFPLNIISIKAVFFNRKGFS
ncbi:hypothetical protein [Flavobacterium sp.]|uniref:hypothetical protein n=1 Tax=Flavobacterium sp. TaxID=239 RepID=UPI002604B4E7|nr:hypothetical protein [Flavobacterium sp.]